MTTEASRVQATIAARPEVVWNALTDTAVMKEFFMGANITTNWQIDSPITFEGEWEGKPYTDKGVIKTFAVGRKLSFTHLSGMSGTEDKPENYHVVTFMLESDGAHTNVVLTQDNLNDAELLSEETRKQYNQNWSSVLNGLKNAAERM